MILLKETVGCVGGRWTNIMVWWHTVRTDGKWMKHCWENFTNNFGCQVAKVHSKNKLIMYFGGGGAAFIVQVLNSSLKRNMISLNFFNSVNFFFKWTQCLLFGVKQWVPFDTAAAAGCSLLAARCCLCVGVTQSGTINGRNTGFAEHHLGSINDE